MWRLFLKWSRYTDAIKIKNVSIKAICPFHKIANKNVWWASKVAAGPAVPHVTVASVFSSNAPKVSVQA